MPIAKILLVEDDADISEVVKFRLEINDYEVKIAEDGEAGLKMLKEFKPDIIICDLRLPKMDGYTLANHIKKNVEFKKIPLVVLATDEQEKDELLGVGVEDIIIKPFEPINLIEKVAHLIMKKKLEEFIKDGQDFSD